MTRLPTRLTRTDTLCPYTTVSRSIESDVLATRMARVAARLAIDAGGSDRDDEAPVGVAITHRKGGPGGVGVDRGVCHATDIGAPSPRCFPSLATKAD